MSGEPAHLHYADGGHRMSPGIIVPPGELDQHALDMKAHLEWHNRTDRAPDEGVEVMVRDAVVTVRPLEPETGDKADAYTIEVHGVSLMVDVREDGQPFVHVADIRQGEDTGEVPLLVEVNASGVFEFDAPQLAGAAARAAAP